MGFDLSIKKNPGYPGREISGSNLLITEDAAMRASAVHDEDRDD